MERAEALAALVSTARYCFVPPQLNAIRQDAQVDSDAADEKALADIEKYGCHILHVQEEGDLPPFSYSMGVQRSSGAPEVVVIGLLEPIAHYVVNEYNRRIRSGERFAPGQLYSGFLEGFDVQFVIADRVHYEEYFGWNRWLYGGNEFDVLQMVYPSTDGVWPWGAGASDWFRTRQPLLHMVQ